MLLQSRASKGKVIIEKSTRQGISTISASGDGTQLTAAFDQYSAQHALRHMPMTYPVETGTNATKVTEAPGD